MAETSYVRCGIETLYDTSKIILYCKNCKKVTMVYTEDRTAKCPLCKTVYDLDKINKENINERKFKFNSYKIYDNSKTIHLDVCTSLTIFLEDRVVEKYYNQSIYYNFLTGMTYLTGLKCNNKLLTKKNKLHRPNIRNVSYGYITLLSSVPESAITEISELFDKHFSNDVTPFASYYFKQKFLQSMYQANSGRSSYSNNMYDTNNVLQALALYNRFPNVDPYYLMDNYFNNLGTTQVLRSGYFKNRWKELNRFTDNIDEDYMRLLDIHFSLHPILRTAASISTLQNKSTQYFFSIQNKSTQSFFSIIAYKMASMLLNDEHNITLLTKTLLDAISFNSSYPALYTRTKKIKKFLDIFRQFYSEDDIVSTLLEHDYLLNKLLYYNDIDTKIELCKHLDLKTLTIKSILEYRLKDGIYT